MKDEIKRLEALRDRVLSTRNLLDIDGKIIEQDNLEREMQAEQFWANPDRAKDVSQRHEEIRKEVERWQTMRQEVVGLLDLCRDLASQEEGKRDPVLIEDIAKDIQRLETDFEHLEFFLLLDGKHDTKNAIVSIHAGSGGTEAQDWAEMLLRMLLRYCEKQGWKTTTLDESRGQEAGIKSAVFRVEGRYAYGHLQSEHGTHRLVRISPFDAEKMRHTSFALIEVIPELEHGESVMIDSKDLRIDTFMSGGHGGQSVNTTYSAVRIVHIPTGITVQCQNERSQLQNKETAMRILQSKLQTLKEEEEEKERQELRGEYKSAEWGNQIRSYVLHPYKMVKDIRTRYEENDPDAVLDGDLSGFVEAYLRWKKKSA